MRVEQWVEKFRIGFEMRLSSLLVVSLLYASPLMAEDNNRQWIFYGTATIDSIQTVCFFDKKSISSISQSAIRIWTKCQNVEDLNEIDFNKTGTKSEYEKRIKELGSGEYFPEYFMKYPYKENDKEFFFNVAAWEFGIQIVKKFPEANVYWEFDCKKNSYKPLQFSQIKKNFSKKLNDEEKYIEPDTITDRLEKISCSLRE